MNVDGLNYSALAHRIVREAACSSCTATPGRRCVSRGRSMKVLMPSRSHRARIETWHAANPIVARP